MPDLRASPAGRTLLIEHGHVLTMNAADEVFPDGCVRVRGRTIDYVGPRASLPEGPVDERIDARGTVVMPGLVNAHTHLCMLFGRGLATDVDLLRWLDVQMPLMRALSDEDLYLAQLLGCVENLRNGNTCVVENLFMPRRADGDAATAAFRAMRDSGVRGTVARAHETRVFAPDFIENMGQVEHALESLAAHWHESHNGRLRLSFGPLLPWSITADELRQTAALSRRLGLGLHMHVAESPEFNRQVAVHHGRPIRQVELLDETGCLGPHVQAVGVSDISAHELALLHGSGTSVVFDPPTRLFWGTGFPSLRPFLEAGIPCALATNGPAANCGQDLFESMKYACAIAKTAAADPSALPARRALRMATIEGARALGLDQVIGSLEAGKEADLITVSTDQPHMSPLHDVPAALVFSARGADVRDVLVQGQVRMRARRMVDLDEADLVARARAAARQVAQRAGVGMQAPEVRP